MLFRKWVGGYVDVRSINRVYLCISWEKINVRNFFKFNLFLITAMKWFFQLKLFLYHFLSFENISALITVFEVFFSFLIASIHFKTSNQFSYNKGEPRMNNRHEHQKLLLCTKSSISFLIIIGEYKILW